MANTVTLEDFAFKQEQLETIAKLTGMVPDAIDDFISLHAKEYTVISNPIDGTRQLVHQASSQDAMVWTNSEARTKWAHYFPRHAEPDLEAAAFGDNPSLTKQMELSRAVGPEEAAAAAARWGTELGNLRPGKVPDESTLAAANRADRIAKLTKELNSLKASAPKPAPGTENPWLGGGRWSLTKQGSIVKALGVAKASQIASAAGCKLGDTKPNPLYNNK